LPCGTLESEDTLFQSSFQYTRVLIGNTACYFGTHYFLLHGVSCESRACYATIQSGTSCFVLCNCNVHVWCHCYTEGQCFRLFCFFAHLAWRKQHDCSENSLYLWYHNGDDKVGITPQ
jgi:hypothetical protein